MTLYLGTVSCDLHKCATRVRVSIPGTDDIPLSVKAVLGHYPRHLFKRNVTVEVEQAQHDGRMFRVTRVFEAMQKPIVISQNFRIEVKDAEEFKRQQGGAEKVQFYLNSKYFENPELLGVLGRVFNVTHEEYRVTFNQGTGLTFICTTDQFARFLIERNLNGIKNGFMDLNAKLIKSAPKPDAYAVLAEEVGITREQAKKVSLALGYSESTFRSRDGYGARNWEPGSDRMHRKLDVSER